MTAEPTVTGIGCKNPKDSSAAAKLCANSGHPGITSKAIEVLSQEKNIKYKLTGMGTILEGELTAVLEALRKMHESVFSDKIQRVVCQCRSG